MKDQQIKLLRRLAAGESPIIQRVQLRWLVRQGLAILGPRAAASAQRRPNVNRTLVLTAKALALIGVESAAPTVAQPAQGDQRDFRRDSGLYIAPIDKSVKWR